MFARHFGPLGFELTVSIPLQAQLFAEAWGVVLGKDVIGILVGRVALLTASVKPCTHLLVSVPFCSSLNW